jgi:hypothetical protein
MSFDLPVDQTDQQEQTVWGILHQKMHLQKQRRFLQVTFTKNSILNKRKGLNRLTATY